MRSQVGCLFAGSRRRVLVSDLAITAYSAPAATARPSLSLSKFPSFGFRYFFFCPQTRRPSYHFCTRRPFHGATHLLQVANDSSQSDTRPRLELLSRQLERFRSLGYVKLTLEISFMEAVQGCTKTVTFQTNVLCGICGGTGGTPGEIPDWCRGCKDTGEIRHYSPNRLETCSLCGGLGRDPKTICHSCKGLCLVKGMKSVQLDLMPGVDDSETIKIQSGAADSRFNNPGDQDELSVIIKVREDPVFRRVKSDIHVDATLGVTQAIFGGFIQVPTLTGDVVVKVGPGTQPGHTTIIRGKGIKTPNSECHGDQYVLFNVRVPVDLMERQRMLVDLFKLEQGD